MFKRAWLGLIDFLYPKSAQIYALETLSPAELLAKLPRAEILTDEMQAIFAYHDERVRELIYELKYRANELITKSLATIAYDVLRAEVAEQALFNNFVNPLLVPIPMSLKRRRERGFNQTEVLATAIMALDTERFFEYRPDILTKTHTESQALTKNKKVRLSNVPGSIKAEVNLKGQNIILLDDVTTKGATFRDARRALREVGARRVICVALAH